MQHSELQQLAYKNRLFVTGRICDVTEYLRELSSKYKTLREYLDELTKEL